MQVVLITRQKNPFDHRLAQAFKREGYRVYVIEGDCEGDLETTRALVQKEAGKIDLYVDVSDERHIADDFTVGHGLNEGVMRHVYEANVLWPMRALETFLPLLDAGQGKRLCFVSSAQASINETRDTDGYGYNLSKAAMHSFFQMIANKLTPSGYTLRIYDPMHREIAPDLAAEAALHYFVRRRGTERQNPLRDDETRLVFRDALGREHTW
ncbi:MAG: SDR family NAD(P)-dependent oxidoreductase [Clostridia bacterium]|nr:SDR family NAD(P)-dependent oxidoreductase [Clostridia bacterium]